MVKSLVFTTGASFVDPSATRALLNLDFAPGGHLLSEVMLLESGASLLPADG